MASGDLTAQSDPYVWKETQSRSVLPKIDVSLLHGKVVQQQICPGRLTESVKATFISHATPPQPTQGAGFGYLPPTAAAGQLQQRKQQSPSPPPFRAGFSYERAHTPDIPARKKEQQRLAQHRLFTSSQPSHRVLHVKQAADPALAAFEDVKELGHACSVSGAGAELRTQGQEDERVEKESSLQQQEQLLLAYDTEAAAACFTDADQLTTKHSSCKTSSAGSAVMVTAAQASNSPLLPEEQQQQDLLVQQQQSPDTLTSAAAAAAGSASSTSGSCAALNRQQRGSSNGYVSSCSSTGFRHPVVGSQGLLHALAVGHGKHALDNLVSESMAMLPGPQLVHYAPSVSCGILAAGKAHTPQSRGQHRQTSFQRSLTAKNSHSGPNSSPRRRSVEKAVGGLARAGGVLGSSAQGSTRFLQGPKRRETDELSEDLPSLDPPAIQPGFNVGTVAASLGHSIQQLRHVEMQQLRQQQEHLSLQQLQRHPGPVAQQTAADKAQPARQRSKMQQGNEEQAAGRIASAGAESSGSNSISKAQGAPRRSVAQQKQGKVTVQGAGAGAGETATPGAEVRSRTRASNAAVTAASGRKGNAASTAVSMAAADAAPQLQASQATTLTLQLRALSASPDLVRSHSKSELLLTQAFSGLATQQQQQQGISAASREGITVGTAAAAPSTAAAAAAGLQAGPVGPVLAQFGGKRNPARDRVLRASWEKQQLWQRQQERLQPGWRATAAASLSSLPAGCTAAGGAAGATMGGRGGSYAAQQAQQRRWGMTAEPYLYSNRTEAGEHLDSSSSTARPALHLPALQHTATSVAGAAAPANQQQQQQQERPATVGLVSRVHLQQLACSISRAVNLQATAMGSAGAEGDDGGSSDAAAARGTVGRGAAVKRPSALGLKAGEVERLIARYHQQGSGSRLEVCSSAFNLDHALAGRQQVHALAAALLHLQDLRMLQLRNNGLKDQDLQVLAAALLNPGSSGVCGLDLGLNQLSPEAPLLLLPLLHQPPQVLLQARRRSTAEAAGESEGLSCNQNPSSCGSKPLPHLSSTASHLGSQGSQSGAVAAKSSNGSCAGGSLSAQCMVSKTEASISWGNGVAACSSSGCVSGSQAGGPLRPLWQQQYGVPHAMLLQLVLCNNPIGDAGAQIVCRLLGTGDCLLQLLDLSGCGITERLSGCLKGMLEGARQLQVLRLGWNMLGPKGGKALAEGLKYCSSGLEQLYLPWSGITDTGASHIAKALESNMTVRLLDLSACQVSAGTCVVLAETLSVNTGLDAIILQDNPLGALGVQKLLKAVHEGHVRHVDIAGCSFLAAPTRQLAGTNSSSTIVAPTTPAKAKKGKSSNGSPAKASAAASGSPAQSSAGVAGQSSAGPKAAAGGQSSGKRPTGSAAAAASAAAAGLKQIGGQAGSAAAAFCAREPDGCYTLDLATPSDRQVAVELMKLTEDHGRDAWVNPTLNKKPYSIAGVTKQSLPSQGVLSVTFVAKHKLSWEAQPLSDPEFHSLWTHQVQPRAAPSRPSLLLQQQELQLPSPGVCWTQQGSSWESPQGSGFDSSWAGNGARGRAVPDGWKLELLQVLLQDCYFTSAQAGQIVAAFSYGEDKVEAAVKVFGRVVDPENFVDQVYLTMNAWQVELADSRIGCLRLFSPDNPTGKYSLLLSHPAQRLVGVRLVELFCQQHIDGRCSFPHSVCFTSASLDDKPLTADMLQDPLKIRLSKSGIFKVCFVDLRVVPPDAKSVSPEGFAVLLSMLTTAGKLDGWQLAQVVDATDLQTKVSVVGRFNTYTDAHGPLTGKVGALRRLRADAAAVTVQDIGGFVEAIHIFAIHHFLTGAQLQELLKLLPVDASEQRVELCSKFWGRLTDRANSWSDVMRSLAAEQQVTLAHRLGVANVFDPVRPSMHYRLRMWRADEHQIAWRLHRMALNATHEAFAGFAIDGKPKKIAQSANLWTVMRGSAAENEAPTVTLDFDFVWQDNLLPQWAAVTIQLAWRAYLIRKAAPPVPRPRLESSSSWHQHALGVRASVAGSKQQQQVSSRGSHGSHGSIPPSQGTSSRVDLPPGVQLGSLSGMQGQPDGGSGLQQGHATSNTGRGAVRSLGGGTGSRSGQPDWEPLLTRRAPHSQRG